MHLRATGSSSHPRGPPRVPKSTSDQPPRGKSGGPTELARSGPRSRRDATRNLVWMPAPSQTSWPPCRQPQSDAARTAPQPSPVSPPSPRPLPSPFPLPPHRAPTCARTPRPWLVYEVCLIARAHVRSENFRRSPASQRRKRHLCETLLSLSMLGSSPKSSVASSLKTPVPDRIHQIRLLQVPRAKCCNPTCGTQSRR